MLAWLTSSTRAVQVLAYRANGAINPGTKAPTAAEVAADANASCTSFATFQYLEVPTGATDCTELSPDFAVNATSFSGSWYCGTVPSPQVRVAKLYVAQVAVHLGFDMGFNLRVVQAGSIVTDASLVCGLVSSPIVLPPLPATRYVEMFAKQGREGEEHGCNGAF